MELAAEAAEQLNSVARQLWSAALLAPPPLRPLLEAEARAAAAEAPQITANSTTTTTDVKRASKQTALAAKQAAERACPQCAMPWNVNTCRIRLRNCKHKNKKCKQTSGTRYISRECLRCKYFTSERLKGAGAGKLMASKPLPPQSAAGKPQSGAGAGATAATSSAKPGIGISLSLSDFML